MFVKNHTALLHDMKKDRKSDLITNKWQTFQQEIFEQLINTFISASVLHHYNSQHKLQMKTDTSETVYASILSQQWKNEWYSIIYFSRKFSSSELNYSVYETMTKSWWQLSWALDSEDII